MESTEVADHPGLHGTFCGDREPGDRAAEPLSLDRHPAPGTTPARRDIRQVFRHKRTGDEAAYNQPEDLESGEAPGADHPIQPLSGISQTGSPGRGRRADAAPYSPAVQEARHSHGPQRGGTAKVARS